MITSASGAVFYVKGLLNECLIIYMTIARERFCFLPSHSIGSGARNVIDLFGRQTTH